MNKSVLMEKPAALKVSNLDLYKKAIIKKIAVLKKENEASLYTFLRTKKLLPQLGTPLAPKVQARPVNVFEKAGELINSMFFSEFEKFDGVDREEYKELVHALFLDGAEAPYFKYAVNDYESRHEMNFTLTLGQLFGVAYPNFRPDEPEPFYSRSICSNLHKIIRLETPYTYDVIVRSKTSVLFPNNRDEAYYAILGNSGMQFCGIDSFANTHLGYKNNSTDVYVDSQNNNFMRVLRSAANNGNDDTDDYTPGFEIINEIKLPAGTTEFCFASHLESKVYVSKDFSNLSALNGSEFGFALIDLRNIQYGKQYPIMRDPLGAWEKQPFGGGAVWVTLEFYTVENNLSI